VEILRYPPAKNETDLELALLEALRRGARWLRIIGGMGGRLDQSYGNILLLSIPQLAGIDARYVSSMQTLWLVGPGTHELDGNVQDTISLLPFTNDVFGITTQGLRYPLINETLRIGPSRGMSNVIDSLPASVSFTDGFLLIVHTIGRA
jgi:thiamine pyrophosphokinase